MIYLLWGLLNVALFIFFIVICFKATRFIREKIGVLAAVIFVFGLLSFAGSPKDDTNMEPGTKQVKTWKFLVEDSLKGNQYIDDIVLEKTWVSEYQLGIKYYKDKEGQVNTPVSAYSTTEGFVSGTNWKPGSIIVNKTADKDAFKYRVDGIIEWKLLGMKLYSQDKVYSGTVSVNN